MAPKLWPISCATTCHSVRPPVLTAVPLTTLGAFPVAFWLHTVPNHATPTSVPDGQPDIRWNRPLGSDTPFKLSNFFPRQAEKSERRSLSDTEPHATFHGLAVSLVGQLGGEGEVNRPLSIYVGGTYFGSWICSSTIPRLMLKVDL